jgi:D-alanyl-D-alanine-carboxypeptidase/D-alanyl-D-alanine-endopeptidase
MVRRFASFALVLLACSGTPKKKSTPEGEVDPDGPHRVAVETQIAPFVEHEIVTGLVIGLYDAGKSEIYGFGKGPDGLPPTGATLFEIGSVTKVYTNLLLADAVQRREVSLDSTVAELLPTGVTVPVAEKTPITLKHLALHSSGLPRLPPSIAANPSGDPYGGYTEDLLYRDLIATRLESPPGTEIVYSNFGTGLLGFALGRKVGGGYTKAIETRVLQPLGLKDTFVTVPASEQSRLATGSDADLQPAGRWTFQDTLAGAGALISTARDQLRLIAAELDAAAGGKGPLRAPMRLTQEPQLANIGANQGLGWQIDSQGRHWHNGGTAGFRTFVAFDLKSRRGIVILSMTSTTLVDLLGGTLFEILEGAQKPAPAMPAPDRLASYAGSYDFAGGKLTVVAEGKKLFIEAQNEPRRRLMPMGEDKFWLEAIQSVCQFQSDDGKVARLVFSLGGRQIVATRAP